ncbi:TPA: hypothetical protein RUZ15_003442 [Vibrio cholerae]|nr:hypothetical protein [Vibrio cholerae]
MNKYLHRLLSAIIAFVMFGLTIYFFRKEMSLIQMLPLVVIFTAIPIRLFLMIPIKCDQNGCEGVAHLEAHKGVDNKLLKLILLTGHRCSECNNLIKFRRKNS